MSPFIPFSLVSFTTLLTASFSAPLGTIPVQAQTPDGVHDGAQDRSSAPAIGAPEADRAAILAMAGEFLVTFAFDETVVLADGYQPAESHRSGAREIVLVEEDHGDRIVLQHILVAPSGHVTKHWRQDWHFEASERLEFVADQRWEVRPVDPELVSGSWTQCVWEVSDAPRYCGTGRWNHRYGHATWTSDRSWRPLPRRDHTKRSDYNALNVENRHTITPHGWTHEQDNTKVVRGPDGTSTSLVREVGFNDYRRTDEVDFAPALEYWEATQAFWSEVRDRWDVHLVGGGLELQMDVDGMPLIVALFQLAQGLVDGEEVDMAEVDAAFARYVTPLGQDASIAEDGWLHVAVHRG